MNCIKAVFDRLKSQGQGALVAYVMAGDPNPEATAKVADALVKGGVDILELGLPFSDPIADGPTIQAASTRALNAGTTPKKVLEIAKEIKKNHPSLPMVIMTYYNPVFKMGLDKFFEAAKACLVDGTIIPDLPLEEAHDYQAAAAKHGVDTIFLTAPSTTDKRLTQMVSASSGFLYLVSRFGVTGAQSTLEESTIRLIKKVLQFTAGQVPLAVGFGVSKPQHVKAIIAAGANGAIVGSIFVNIIAKGANNPKKMLTELESTARTLKVATTR